MISPWHTRIPLLEEDRRYKNLIDLHRLTQLWIKAAQPTESTNASSSIPNYKITRFIPPELKQTLWLLEKLRLDRLPPGLETLVDASTVSEYLDELNETVQIVQSSILENLILEADSPNRSALLNQLEQVSWTYGKTIAEERWNANHSFPAVSERGPIVFFEAFKNSPYWSHEQSFLLNHAHSTQVSFYWMTSPLIRNHAAAQDLMNLCHMHLHAIQGYFYGLSRSLRCEIIPSQLGSQRSWQIDLKFS
jgi:hypothetical protein